MGFSALCNSACKFFKPQGVSLQEPEQLALGLDELEALRLADLEGLYQEKTVECMKVSRPTFARIVESARRKIAEALVKGKALKSPSMRAVHQAQSTLCG